MKSSLLEIFAHLSLVVAQQEEYVWVVGISFSRLQNGTCKKHRSVIRQVTRKTFKSGAVVKHQRKQWLCVQYLPSNASSILL